MKKTFLKVIMIIVVTVFSLTTIASAAVSDYGSSGAKVKSSYSNEEMLKYAIQDEYLALAEYEKIISTFGVQTPFTNIIKAENNHISLLKPLFEKYGVSIPENTAKNLVIIPDSMVNALKIGVQAEIDNIAMYDKFLKQNLPSDIKDIFTYLKNASQNHLKAFERGVSREEGTQLRNSNSSKGRLAGRRGR